MNRLLPTTTIDMHMKFEIEIPKQTWLTLRKPCHLQSPENQKIQYGCQAAILKMTLLKINRLLPIYISIVPLKFGVDMQSQTKGRVWKPKKIQYGCLAAILKLTLLKINRLLHIYRSIVPLKFGVDIQSQTKVRVWKPKNPIWPPGGHFESDVVENEKASAHDHHRHAYEVWNWNSKANLTYTPETMPPTESRNQKIQYGRFENDVAENQ